MVEASLDDWNAKSERGAERRLEEADEERNPLEVDVVASLRQDMVLFENRIKRLWEKKSNPLLPL